MERVSLPIEVEMIPGEPWVKRLKYTEVSELIADYEQSNMLSGRKYCPVLDHMRQHASDPLEDVEEHIYSHPAWGPTALCETMWKTLAFNRPEDGPNAEFVAGWVQHFCALRLARHDFANARLPLSDMLKHPTMRFISPGAAYVVLAYLSANHPNPRKFLEKPEVAAKFAPFALDISAFPAPDFD